MYCIDFVSIHALSQKTGCVNLHGSWNICGDLNVTPLYPVSTFQKQAYHPPAGAVDSSGLSNSNKSNGSVKSEVYFLYIEGMKWIISHVV